MNELDLTSFTPTGPAVNFDSSVYKTNLNPGAGPTTAFNPTGPAITVDASAYGTQLNRGLTRPRSETPTSYPATRGAAISVFKALSNITFVEGTFGGMSSSIAYIRYWSRSGVQQKTSAGATALNGAPADSQASLASDYARAAGLSLGVSPTTTAFSTGSPGSEIPPVTGEFYGSTPLPSRTVLTTPTNTAYQSRPRQPVPNQTSEPRPEGNPFLSTLGSLFNANPGGTSPASSNPFYTPQAAPSPGDAVWQFLFNPEELQLESGPDYNRAETWGVSDPANSGQPLSWRSNKNRKLTFGKVVLHGYTFGKRVDSLEKGLQQLFMARDGENGADGPPVLEFVWGKRVFGPCVIQNIRVREQSWDSGILVNAEVSFELEQVPEWTINDGFVDVVRPGRQPVLNDPTLPSQRDAAAAAAAGADGGEGEPKNQPGGGGGNRTATVSQCNNSSSDIESWSKFIERVKVKQSGVKKVTPRTLSSDTPLDPLIPLPLFPKIELVNTFPNFANEYLTLRNKARSNSLYKNGITLQSVGDKCLNFDTAIFGFNNSINKPNLSVDQKSKINSFYNQQIIDCSTKIKAILNSSRNSLGCGGTGVRQDSQQLPRDLNGRSFQGPVIR